MCRYFSMIRYFITFTMAGFQQQKRRYLLYCYTAVCFFTLQISFVRFQHVLNLLIAVYLQVYEAARKAAIHDTITSFPEKYSTVVGERGLKVMIPLFILDNVFQYCAFMIFCLRHIWFCYYKSQEKHP